MSHYSTNLTEKQWQVIKKQSHKKNGKKCLREILNAIFYISKSGCQWRMLPSGFAPWQTVDNISIMAHLPIMISLRTQKKVNARLFFEFIHIFGFIYVK